MNSDHPPRLSLGTAQKGPMVIGGALSPIVFGVLVQFGSWQAPFIVAASLLVLGSAVWAFWLDPGTSERNAGRDILQDDVWQLRQRSVCPLFVPILRCNLELS